MKLISIHKGKFYMVMFLVTASILGWGIWNNYRPQVVYASCADIAEKTSNLRTKKNIVEKTTDNDFDSIFNECLSDSGYYAGK